MAVRFVTDTQKLLRTCRRAAGSTEWRPLEHACRNQLLVLWRSQPLDPTMRSNLPMSRAERLFARAQPNATTLVGTPPLPVSRHGNAFVTSCALVGCSRVGDCNTAQPQEYSQICRPATAQGGRCGYQYAVARRSRSHASVDQYLSARLYRTVRDRPYPCNVARNQRAGLRYQARRSLLGFSRRVRRAFRHLPANPRRRQALGNARFRVTVFLFSRRSASTRPELRRASTAGKSDPVSLTPCAALTGTSGICVGCSRHGLAVGSAAHEEQARWQH